jgi:hypothetical protein
MMMVAAWQRGSVSIHCFDDNRFASAASWGLRLVQNSRAVLCMKVRFSCAYACNHPLVPPEGFANPMTHAKNESTDHVLEARC